MTAIYYMLLRDETYKKEMCKDNAPKRGKIELEKLIEHYKLKGYTVFAKSDSPSYVAGEIV